MSLVILRDSRLLVLLAAGSLTSMVGGVVAPVLPEIVQQLQLNPGLAGNLVSMHCLTFALFSPLLGILADRIGKLRVLIPSLIFYALFGMVGALMQSFWPLLIARGLIGAASGGIAAASLGLLGTMYEGEERSQVMGFVTSTLTLAGIVFPLLGGWVGSTHWQYSFYLYGLALLLIPPVVSIFRHKSVTPIQSVANSDRQKLGDVLRSPQILRLLLTLCLASVTVYAVVVYAPMYLKATIGASTTINGIVLASRAIGAAVISAFGARYLAKRFGMTGATILGLGLMALTLMTIPLLRQLNQIIPAAVLFGVGLGTVMPALYGALADLAPSELRSSVLAVGTGAGYLGQFLCPILLGTVLSYSGLPEVFYSAASIALVTGLLLMAPIGKKGIGTSG